MLYSCGEKGIQEQKVKTLAISQLTSYPNLPVDTSRIDLRLSSLRWKGTKLMGLGKHEGDIRIREGYLLLNKDELIGGRFIIRMTSLRVTDIPASDPIPLRNLTAHLKSEDFFAVDKYPNAILDIVKVTKVGGNYLLTSAMLEIKGIRKPIEFAAEMNKNSYKASFKLDRFDWNIACEGSWADRTLVDREIEVWVELTRK
jgi:polyisoprenoid-binding protein YceI